MKYYAWPASALNPSDMALLYRTRETGERQVPISQLIVQAIRKTYGETNNRNREEEAECRKR